MQNDVRKQIDNILRWKDSLNKNYNVRKPLYEEDSSNLILELNAEEIKLKYYPDINQEMFDKIVGSDKLTSNIKNGKVGKYAKWLLRLYLEKKLKFNDLSRAEQYIEVYDKLLKSNKLKNKDINNYKTLDDIYDVIEEYIKVFKNMELRKFKTTLREFLNERQEVENNLNDNFWKWFGSSKVKDGEKPLILYHGTKTNFSVFKPSKSIGNQGETDQIEGMYFTTNKDAASFFSIGDDERYLKPVYLSLKNPYFTDGNNELKKELGIDKLKDANKTLKSLGYDGLIMNRGFYAKGGPFVLYLAFYPNQIKSINNDGSWDINDDDIYS